MSEITNKIVQGLRSPEKIIQYFRRRKAEIGIHIRNKNITSQDNKIKELLTEDQFLLIIFDSCRYDYFNQTYPAYYSGNLNQVYTTNTYTKQYQTTTWPETYNLTYVAGGPVISDRTFELSDLSYRPSEHFDTIVDAWNKGYRKELGVTPPEAVTEAALEQNDPRMIVHYFQPHAPYIGDKQLREKYTDDQHSTIKTRMDSLIQIYERIEAGEIEPSTLQEAYEGNLHRVMRAAQPLVNKTSHRTVITADHGELLGEDGRYLHGGLPHPILCEVPWFEVNEVIGEIEKIAPSVTEKRQQNANVEDQLRDLGYLQ